MKLDMEVAYKQPNLFYMSMNAEILEKLWV